MARFIVLEGIDGVGKSTQATLLAEALGARLVRDGSRVSARARAEQDPLRVAELYIMGRRELSFEIADLLDAGNDVVCDRWETSTRCYQRAAGIAIQKIEDMIWADPPFVQPDVTFWLQMPLGLALERLRVRYDNYPPEKIDRYERSDFLTRVLREYEKLPDLVPIDADQAPEKVTASMLDFLQGTR